MTLTPTPTFHELKLNYRFASLSTALDYAAAGDTGCNYFDAKGELRSVVSYRSLRHCAHNIARRLGSLSLQRGTRVALVAETQPIFHELFFGCQYAGFVPVPVAPPVQLAGAQHYVKHLQALLIASGARLCIGPAEYLDFMQQAADGLGLEFVGTPLQLGDIPENHDDLCPLESNELAYLQFTSGSTQFPRGVAVTQCAVMNNLECIIERLEMRSEDRAVSWLPYYHDMGLVGFVLAPLACQMSIDYLGTRDFAMRPRQWLQRISASKATISFAPPFGYELCARRLRHDDVSTLDLSSWRVAGVGSEVIHEDVLARFGQLLAPCGFRKKAFVACYGLAESTLAVTISPLNKGLQVDKPATNCSQPSENSANSNECGQESLPRAYVNCGRPIRGHEIEVRDVNGRTLRERNLGVIFVRGPSLMSGYVSESGIGSEVLELTHDGWLNTGDLGYLVEGDLFVTGREKDLIIVNGRNIWPQDLESLIESFVDLRPGDSSVFSVRLDDEKAQTVVAVIQYRKKEPTGRYALIEWVRQTILSAHGIDCIIDLVPPHTIARTSSGKQSKYKTRDDYLKRRKQLDSTRQTTAA